MAVSRIRQDKIWTEGSSIDDTLDPTSHDGSAVDLKDTIDYMCSQFADILGETNWYDAPDATIAAMWAKTWCEDKLAMRDVQVLVDVSVPASQNYVVLSQSGGETPSRPISKGATTTEGSVCAELAGDVGSHALTELAGNNALNPKNLCMVWDASTGDPIESSGRQVYALLQCENGATQGGAWNDTTNQGQLSFVRPNSTYDDLEACPVADIESTDINYSYGDREDLAGWSEQDFRQSSVHVDLASAAISLSLDSAYDGGSVVDVDDTNVDWRLTDTKRFYVSDSAGATNILEVAADAAGDEVEINADTFDVNVGSSGTVDFDQGITVDSGGTAINLGVTAGQIDAGAAALKIDSSGAAVTVEGVGVILDATTGNLQADGVQLDVDTTDNSHVIMAANDAGDKEMRVAGRNAGAGDGDLYLEADDDIFFETAQETSGIPLDDATAGAISGLWGQSFASISAAIKYAGETAGTSFEDMSHTVLGSNYAKDANVPGATFDQTGYTMDMSGDAATMFVFLNGRLQAGASAADTADVYPGTTPASGDIKFSYSRGVKSGDVVIAIGFK